MEMFFCICFIWIDRKIPISNPTFYLSDTNFSKAVDARKFTISMGLVTIVCLFGDTFTEMFTKNGMIFPCFHSLTLVNSR